MATDLPEPGSRAERRAQQRMEPEHHTVEQLIRHRLTVALGGWHGSLESAAPTVAFLVSWTWRHDLAAALWAAVCMTACLLVVRLVQRTTPRFVLMSVVPTALSAFFALRSGRAEDAFLPGILTNAAYAVLFTVSILARWPAVGFMVGLSDPKVVEDPFAWRRDAGVVRVCRRLTWPLVGLYALRVAVMLPLYQAHQVGALGVMKLVLGWPAWILVLVLLATMLARGSTPIQLKENEAELAS